MKKTINYILLIIICQLSMINCFAQQSNPELTVNAGHSEAIVSVCFSPDGKYVLSSSLDQTIKLWQISTGKMIRTFSGHSGWVNSACFSPDGKFILSGSEDKTLKLWDILTGKVIKTFLGHTDRVKTVCFSPDGKYALSGSEDDAIKQWDVSTGKEVRTFLAFSDVNAVCFSSDLKSFFSAGISLILWDINQSKPLKDISYTEAGSSTSVCISPDGKFALSGNTTNTLMLWSIPKIKKIKTFTGHTKEVHSVCFSPDGKFVLSGSKDETIILWDISTGKAVRTFLGHTGEVNSVCFSPDGKYALSGGGYMDNTIKLWDISTGKLVKTFSGHSKGIRAASFSPNGKYLLSSGLDSNSVKLWGLSIGKVVKTFSGGSYYFNCFSPDSKYALSGSPNWRSKSNADNKLNLWDIETGMLSKTFSGHTGVVHCASFSPDGAYILSGSDDKELKLWDVSTGEAIRSFYRHTDEVNSLCFSPDGNYAVSGGGFEDKTINLWDISTAKVLMSVPAYVYNGDVRSVAFSPEGKSAISTSMDGTIKLWDIFKGDEIKTFAVNSGLVNSVCFSPDGKYILCGNDDNSIKLLEISTGNEVRNFVGHAGSIHSVSFSPDGKRILSCSEDNSMKIWDYNTAKEIVSFCWYGEDWISITPDLYFDCSKDGGESVSMIMENHGYNIDQLALKYNRPDIILERLGSTDNDLIQHYYNQYKKRLRKSGFTEEQLSSELHVPVASITYTKQSDKFITVSFNLSDDKYNLKKYNVYVNDVPIFGAYGKEVTGNNMNITENIELTSGENKIEISCLNEKGAESFRELAMANFQPVTPIKPDLYYIGFGVSNYKDVTLNLNYADKDAKDLADACNNMKGQFGNVYVKTFTNEECTVDNIKKAKDLLKNAKPDDVFILFIAGHGTHDNDKEATYYFITYETERNNLKGSAANFETIEDLLQGIAPRNKLFLMDACESGEIDDDEQTNFIALAGSQGMKSRGFTPSSKNAKTQSTTTAKRTYLYQKDRYIYNDLARRSGAIVFSSSKGGELSYERSDIQNGLFTSSIIKALTSQEADKNSDGTISTDELREYVSTEVGKTSDDLQHPTVDRDNIYQKFGFGVVK